MVTNICVPGERRVSAQPSASFSSSLHYHTGTDFFLLTDTLFQLKPFQTPSSLNVSTIMVIHISSNGHCLDYGAECLQIVVFKSDYIDI